jgi:hypothetical protein
VVSQARAERIATHHVQRAESPDTVTSELIVYAPGSSATRLSWKVILVGQSSDWIIVVDALTGNILTSYNQINTDGERGSSIDLTNATGHLNVWYGDDLLSMIDTSKFVYRDQPGALNEAFSAIFGEMAAAYANGSKDDWIMGMVLDDNLHNLNDPSSMEITAGYHYPSKMSEFYRRESKLLQMLEDEDYGGVHINMTIITHAFYLLAEGLTDAIGQDKAAAVFYRAQTVHLVTNSQFIDMRLACIQSAEELYGADSIESQKVEEAFDAVEILEENGTLDRAPGDDSYIFIAYRDDVGLCLARRETAQGDDENGSWLSARQVKRARPSVSDDGDLAFFVDASNDACFIETDTYGSEECLGMSGQVYSGAMSSNEQLYGVVLLDDHGNPMNQIMIIDMLTGGTDKVLDLTAPETEGYSIQTVMYADTMDFTSDNRYLIYDAYSILELEDGSQAGAWSIYAIDLETEETVALIPPTLEHNIGYPAISQTTDYMLTWDQYSTTSGVSTVVAGNLNTGDTVAVGTVTGDYGVPGYNGDDSAIAYGQADASYITGYTMMLQPLADDMMTPAGSPTSDLVNAEFGVIYRRATSSVSVSDMSISPANVNFGNAILNETATRTITIENSGSANLTIEDLKTAGANHAMFAYRSNCIGQQFPADASCSVIVDFTPTSLGIKSAALIVTSDAQDTPVLSVSLSGTGVLENSGDSVSGDADSDGSTSDGAGGGGGGGGGCMISTISSGNW